MEVIHIKFWKDNSGSATDNLEGSGKEGNEAS